MEKRRRIILLIGTCLFLNVTRTSPASAWVTNSVNCKFNGPAVRMYDYGAYYTLNQWSQIVNHAASNWNNSTDVDTITSGVGTNTHIVYWKKVATSQYTGLTSYPGCSSGLWTGNSIITMGSTVRFQGDLGADRNTAVHELGHAIGLGHPAGQNCNAPPGIMQSTDYSYFTCGLYTLTQDEVAGANALY
jgi:hypothetical protein